MGYHSSFLISQSFFWTDKKFSGKNGIMVFLASSMPLACLAPFGSQPIGLLTGKSIEEGPVRSYKLTLLALINIIDFCSNLSLMLNRNCYHGLTTPNR
jgi:hypothetical protein